ncbi:MAG: hypothetical protein ABI832_01820 [bacterium]
MERMIQMIINMVIRQVVNRGVRSGIDHVVGKGKPKSQMTSAERIQAQDAAAIAKRARQAANLARRMGR